MELADLPKHFLSRSGAQCVWVAGEWAGHDMPKTFNMLSCCVFAARVSFEGLGLRVLLKARVFEVSAPDVGVGVAIA